MFDNAYGIGTVVFAHTVCIRESSKVAIFSHSGQSSALRAKGAKDVTFLVLTLLCSTSRDTHNVLSLPTSPLVWTLEVN